MPDDPLLLEAQTAIGLHDKKKAREILRRLIKADSHNIEYWLWLSVSVDTPREITYCLQEALKIDPDNKIAKKGLIFYGVIKPEPFHEDDLLSKKRDWKQEYIRKFAPPPPEKKPAPIKKRISPIIWIGLGIALVLSVSLISGFPWTFLKRQAPALILKRPTQKPSATYLPTKTPIGYVAPVIPTPEGPIPLWDLLDATYTPTPLYINTPHSSEAYLLAMRAYENRNFDTFRKYIDQAIAADPDNADYYYYLAEADKQQNRNNPAMLNYEKALNINPKFAPAYLGRARMNLLLYPTSKKIIFDINSAIENDPAYSDAFLERARYYIRRHQLAEAQADLEMVLRINPQTPVAHALLSEIYLTQDKPEDALKEAQIANDMDLTLLQSYLALGSAYIANGEPSKSIDYLKIYTDYAQLDARAYEFLGVAYWAIGDIDLTIEKMSQSIQLDTNSFTPYLLRGLAYMQINNLKPAFEDLTEALGINDNSFIAVFNRAKVSLLLGRNTDAYNQFLRAENLRDDPNLEAEVIYYQAKAALAMGDRNKIIDAWKRLLALPNEKVPQAWVDEAKTYLYPCKGSKCPTFTPSPTLQSTACLTTFCPTSIPLVATLTTTPTPIQTITATP
jgi:tetratricopeptide (TPR) repeat protein